MDHMIWSIKNMTEGSSDQASAGRRHPGRPEFSNSLLSSWDPWFLSEMFADYARRPFTKTRTSVMTISTGTRDSKTKDGKDVDVLRSPASDYYCKLYFKCLGDNSLQYLSSWYNMCCACISKWLHFNFWFTFGDFRSSNERRFNNAFGCYLFAILDFRFDKWSLCFAKVSLI